MIERRVLMKLILLVVVLVGKCICKETYGLKYTDGLSDCDDFKNKIFKGDGMGLGKTSEDGQDSMYLEGCLEFCDPIDEGTLIEIEVMKETELGSEPMWSCSMDVCKSLDDKDAPWAAAMKVMNITACPIATGKYCAERVELDMSFAKDYMYHEFVGDYGCKILLTNTKKDAFSCHNLGLCIAEEEK